MTLHFLASGAGRMAGMQGAVHSTVAESFCSVHPNLCSCASPSWLSSSEVFTHSLHEPLACFCHKPKTTQKSYYPSRWIVNISDLKSQQCSCSTPVGLPLAVGAVKAALLPADLLLLHPVGAEGRGRGQLVIQRPLDRYFSSSALQ